MLWNAVQEKRLVKFALPFNILNLKTGNISLQLSDLRRYDNSSVILPNAKRKVLEHEFPKTAKK